MKKIFIFLLALFALQAKAQTPISAGSVSGTWTVANSPYLINGDITIASGQTLTIQPNVKVMFQGSYSLSVQGRLLAQGEAAKIITFTCNTTATGWAGFKFANTPAASDSSLFSYCQIEFANNSAFTITGACKVRISNSTIASNWGLTGGAFNLSTGANPLIRKNTITGNYSPAKTTNYSSTGKGGGFYISASSPTISENTISSNNARVDGGDSYGGGMYIENSANPYIANNYITANIAYSYSNASYGGAMYIDNSNPYIVNNKIFDNLSTGYYTIYHYGGGVYLINASPKLHNNTILYNTSRSSGSGIYLNNSYAKIYNSIIWGNDVYFANNCYPKFMNCDVSTLTYASGVVYDLTLYIDNISSNPLLNADYSLQAGSPCINKGLADTTDYNLGLPAKDILGNVRVQKGRIDMGAVEMSNLAPTNIILSTTSIVENAVLGSKIATLTSTDDTNDSKIYSLVVGTGSTDNDSFTLDGSDLKLNTTLNIATKSSYSIRLRTTDSEGLIYEKSFTLTVTSIPSNITLSVSSISENAPVGTSIGTFSTVGGTSYYTYSLESGNADNSFFSIGTLSRYEGLYTNATLNYASKSSYTITVRSTDNKGFSFLKSFVINIVANQTPTNIVLDKSSVKELSSGQTVGYLSSIDDSYGTGFTYSLVSGIGDTDNSKFTITSPYNWVSTNTTMAAYPNSYSVRVRTTDSKGLFYDKVFTISVAKNQSPSNIMLSKGYVDENSAVGTTVATLSASDPDDWAGFTYSLLSGISDNSLFTISGTSFKTAASFDYETKPFCAIRIRVTDVLGAYYDKDITVTVNNVNESPVVANPLENKTTLSGIAFGYVLPLNTFSDPEKNTLTYTAKLSNGNNLPSWLTFNSAGFSFTGTPSISDIGTYVLRVTASDGTYTCYTDFTITVLNAASNYLIPSNTNLSINVAANSTATLGITSNIAWTISSNQTWLTVSSLSGTGSASLTLMAAENLSSSRTAILTLSTSVTGVASQTITITQAGVTPILNVSTSNLTINAPANSSSTFNVTSNIAWNVSSNQNWLTVSNTSGANNATLTVTAAENTLGNTRVATITVAGIGANTQTVLVTQAGVVPILSVVTNTLNASANSENLPLAITSNTNWTVTSNQSWLGTSNASGLGNSIISLTATANTSTATRTASITISASGLVQTIIVTQAGVTLALNVSTNIVTIVGSSATTKTFDIISNTNWTATSNNPTWLSVNQGSGSNNATITVSVTESTSTVARTGTISVSGTGVTTQIITVTQTLVAPTTSVSTTALTISNTATFDIISNTNWTVVSNQTWLTVNTASGSNNATITLTAMANSTNSQRTATVTVSDGVNSYSIIVIQNSVVTEITDLKEDETVIYPNPTKDILYLTTESDKVSISIYDINGKILVNQEVSDKKVNVSNLKNGVYAIKIVDSKGLTTKKFVKQ